MLQVFLKYTPLLAIQYLALRQTLAQGLHWICNRKLTSYKTVYFEFIRKLLVLLVFFAENFVLTMIRMVEGRAVVTEPSRIRETWMMQLKGGQTGRQMFSCMIRNKTV